MSAELCKKFPGWSALQGELALFMSAKNSSRYLSRSSRKCPIMHILATRGKHEERSRSLFLVTLDSNDGKQASPGPKCKAMRSALLLFLLPGLAATDNAICAVLSPAIKKLDSVPGLECSCESDGTASNIGGDAECDLTFGPPPVVGLQDMKITFHAGTTVRPCATPATASVVAGISLPVLSSTEECSIPGGSCTDNDSPGGGCALDTGTCASPDSLIDTMVNNAVTALKASAPDMAGEVEYEESTNKITVSLSVEAGKSKEVEVPIQKWGVADFYAKVSLTVAGSMSGLTTTQAVDLCMKAGGTEICGADIPKCDGTYSGNAGVKTAQATICTGSGNYNWHELFGAPPITMFPPQEMKFTDACKASTVAAPPPPPTVTLTMQASGNVADYADTTAFLDYTGKHGERTFKNVLKSRIGVAACTMKTGTLSFGKDCYNGIRGQGLKDYDSAIAVTITPASVIITAVITASSDSAAAEISDSLIAKLSTAEAASKEIGITIEATPTVVVYSPAAGESSTNAGAVAGAVISVLLFLGTIATIVYLVKKERIANPLDRLKEKLGKKKVHVMENGANAELATAKPA